MPRPRLSWLLFLIPLVPLGCARSREVHVGSKAFPGSVVLGELAVQMARSAGARARHLAFLGDTSKTWNALLVGDLDAYVEYTGTLTQEILAGEHLRTEEELRGALAERGLLMSRSLGFSDNYALGMKERRAADLGVRRISDLRAHPDLRLGLSITFIERGDGWAGLKRRYDLPFATPRAVDHALSYRGLDGGSLDVIDVYTTDAEIKQYGVRVLADDRHYFPAYDAVLLYRADLPDLAPHAVTAMLRLEGAIDAATMQSLNLRAVVEKVPEATVAADFLHERFGLIVDPQVSTLPQRLLRATGEHLLLVSVSLLAAILTAVPLGVLAARRPWLGQVILALVGVVQTFPSLALLSVLIVLLRQVGPVPAIVALYVYSLLPIVRNTFTGLHDVPLNLRESAEALGLSSWARLRLIELPMASRAILAGVKTAAVINVGFATLGGLIAAGGYGQAILAGLNKNDPLLMLEGAVPAVLLALAVQGLFDVAERFLVPRGLRLKPAE
jgi:osmoprotectant transport system permease protein